MPGPDCPHWTFNKYSASFHFVSIIPRVEIPFPLFLHYPIFLTPRAGGRSELGPYAKCSASRREISHPLSRWLVLLFRFKHLFNPFLKVNSSNQTRYIQSLCTTTELCTENSRSRHKSFASESDTGVLTDWNRHSPVYCPLCSPWAYFGIYLDCVFKTTEWWHFLVFAFFCSCDS